MYVFQIHNMAKIFWGAWPLVILEVPKCSKLMAPRPSRALAKRTRFTNGTLWPLDFIHSKCFRKCTGGVGPPGKQPAPATISGVRPPYVARKGYHYISHHINHIHTTIDITTSKGNHAILFGSLDPMDPTFPWLSGGTRDLPSACATGMRMLWMDWVSVIIYMPWKHTICIYIYIYIYIIYDTCK